MILLPKYAEAEEKILMRLVDNWPINRNSLMQKYYINIIKNLLIIVFLSWFVYYFKLYSVIKSRFLYNGLHLPTRENDISFNLLSRVLFETVLYFVIVLAFSLFFRLLSKYFELDKIIILTVVVSPLLFEISTIFYDKSCFKPWYNFDTFLWYFPMRLVLWTILYFCFKDLMPMLKSRRNLIIIGCVFLIFHVFKIYSRHNF
jgi:hypothetical protein